MKMMELATHLLGGKTEIFKRNKQNGQNNLKTENYKKWGQ